MTIYNIGVFMEVSKGIFALVSRFLIMGLQGLSFGTKFLICWAPYKSLMFEPHKILRKEIFLFF